MEKIKPDMSGVKAIIKVDGFYDAKRWMYQMLDAGVAKCSSCDNPATRIFWQDRAEWYFECDDHWTPHGMWSGSTGWEPEVFTKQLVPEKVREWYEALPPEDRAKVKLKKYDRVDWDSLLVDGWMTEFIKDELIQGREGWGLTVRVYPLKDGQFAYQTRREMGNTTWVDGLFAPFESIEAAVEDARGKVKHG